MGSPGASKDAGEPGQPGPDPFPTAMHMKFVSYLRLALALVTIVGLLGLPAGAQAADAVGDPSSSASTAANQPAATSSATPADAAPSSSNSAGSTTQSQSPPPAQTAASSGPGDSTGS